jgi:RNA recognition motif-containing protein
LSFKAHENDIGDHFSAFGEVESVKILKDQNGRSKGGAFVKFETE